MFFAKHAQVFGIGLDDVFILSGSFERTDKTKSIEERVHDTIEDCGLSITLTTLTSASAFGLGCISSIPAIYWLCLYAVPTIVFVLLFQLTFFTACLVLDVGRRNANKRDCCVCCTAKMEQEDQDAQDGDGEEQEMREPSDPTELLTRISERRMGQFANLLFKPYVKAFVIAAFVALGVVCALSAAKLEQNFDAVDVLPSDSYVADLFNAFEDYTSRSGAAPFVYFRDVDQSDPDVQQAMEDYLEALVGIKAIEEGPEFFWLRDFRNFTMDLNATLTFNEQVELFLADPVWSEVYGEDIVVDTGTGDILTSRCNIFMDNIDFEVVSTQIDALEDQRSVTKAQPINKGRSDWAFFTYDSGIYDIWEFYSVSVTELILTTIMGIVSVTALTIILVPHWTAVWFILPLICLLYVDLLGVLQWAGVSINPVSYVTLVLSIGLMVDFLMHMLLRYYEASGNRVQKVKETLETMGVSIMIGGISTFLGTLPLAFSTSEIYTTVFIAFLGLVLLGLAHGLILLPVLLSLVGPEDDPLEVQPWKRQSIRCDASSLEA